MIFCWVWKHCDTISRWDFNLYEKSHFNWRSLEIYELNITRLITPIHAFRTCFWNVRSDISGYWVIKLKMTKNTKDATRTLKRNQKTHSWEFYVFIFTVKIKVQEFSHSSWRRTKSWNIYLPVAILRFTIPCGLEHRSFLPQKQTSGLFEDITQRVELIIELQVKFQGFFSKDNLIRDPSIRWKWH